jgi:hypothetical protein
MIKIRGNFFEPYFYAQPKNDWHEDYGSCLWWKFPIVEEPYVGSPLDDDFPFYVTHFTKIITPFGYIDLKEDSE